MGERLQPKDIGLREHTITKHYSDNKMLRGVQLIGLKDLGKAILKKFQLKKKKKKGKSKPGQVDYDARSASDKRAKEQKDAINKIFK
jgi:hypothetical protein